MTAAMIDGGFQTIKGAYSLDRNFTAASRLNLQFYLWKDSLKFNLHPAIPAGHESGGEGVRIADVATGTGIWLLDIAHELPYAQLDGLDISLDNAPEPSFAPKQIRFRTCNVFEEPPEELVGVFDVVHLRLLVLVVQNSNPEPIIRNVVKLLKPGGWLQWDDLNYPDTCVRKPPGIGPTPAFDELRKYVYSEGRHDWIMKLPQLFGNHGLTDCQLNHYVDQPALTRANGDQHLMTMAEFAQRLAKSGKKDEANQVEEMLSAVFPEAAKGAAFSMPRVVCVGRKSN